MKHTTQNTQKFCQDLNWKVTKFSRNMPEGKNTIPLFFEKHLSNDPETKHVYTKGANSTLTQKIEPRVAPGFRAINTHGDLGRTP